MNSLTNRNIALIYSVTIILWTKIKGLWTVSELPTDKTTLLYLFRISLFTNQNWHLSRSMTNEPLIQVSREMQISFLTLKECQKTCHDAIRKRINRIASFTSSPGLDLQLRHFILHLRVLKFNCFKLTLLEKGFICSQDG